MDPVIAALLAKGMPHPQALIVSDSIGAIVPVPTPYGAAGSVLRSTGAAAEWGQVNLADTDAVTGILPAVNLPTSTETAVGAVELATAAETQTGTSTTLATHPAGVAATYPKSSLMTTRGDLIRRGASVPERLPVGATNTVIGFDGTDTSARTLTSIIDGAFGSTRGMILRRGASAWEALAIGTSGYVLQSDGTDPAWAALSSYSVDIQTFNASGTWTRPSSGTYVFVYCWGGGGSGGRAGSTDGGGGGGGGGFQWGMFTRLSLGATETVTIGAGGAARTSDETNGATGGNSTFGSRLTAYGGIGGAGATTTFGEGGGGGGALGVGTAWQGGSPRLAFSPGTGDSTCTLVPSTGGGDGGTTSGAAGQASVYGGAGGGAGATTGVPNAGGASIWGGGGGGGGSGDTSPGSNGGTSKIGGNGGAGATGASAATAGTQPGGGGGGSESGNSGAGGDGRCIVIVV